MYILQILLEVTSFNFKMIVKLNNIRQYYGILAICQNFYLEISVDFRAFILIFLCQCDVMAAMPKHLKNHEPYQNTQIGYIS